MGTGNGQGSGIMLGMISAHLFQVFYLGHDSINDLGDILARARQATYALAMTLKNLDAQLLLQLNDGLGHARLRGMQGTRCIGQIKITSNRLTDKAKLL